MLVIVGDMHLTDGSRPSLSATTVTLFVRQLGALVESASWRADGRYRPLDRVDLLLLGDILDPIRSKRWQTGTQARPWNAPSSLEAANTFTNIVHDILEHNSAAVDQLRALSTAGTTIPAAAGSGRPSHDALVAVPVHLHYLVGDTDWFLHCPGALYQSARVQVAQQLGLASYDRPLAHEPTDDQELLAVLRRHKVWARHGDRFDPLYCDGERAASSLADALQIELVGPVMTHVESDLADALPAPLIAGVRELDNVRPLLSMPAWIESLIARSEATVSAAALVRGAWDRLVDRFLSLPLLGELMAWDRATLVDNLAWALRFRGLKGDSSRRRAAVAALEPEHSFAQQALAEPEFRNRRARHIVYGHTHRAEMLPLDTSTADGYVLNQWYFNAGSWRRTWHPTLAAAAALQFVPVDVLSGLAFYQGDEREGRPFESWSNALGARPEGLSLRVDPAAVGYVPAHHLSTPKLHTGGPHLAGAVAQSRTIPTRRQR